MKGRWMKRALSIMLISVFAVTLCVGIGLKTVKAEETADTLATLFSETNTYSTTNDRITIQDTSNAGDDGKYGNSQFYLTYDMTEKNDNAVAAKSQITVLTHGFGSRAYAWSNKLTYDENGIGDGVEFTPTKASLIYKYWQKYGSNLKVLFAGFERLYNEERTIENILNFKYVDLTAQTAYAFNNNVFEEYDISTTTENLFEGFTANNHMLVLFESGVTNDSNDNVYFQFNYLLSKIAKQYKDKTNTLPKYNLVGHSRGGLTNLQYALDHPDMVDNLISIGTPYNGSTTATVFGENVCGEADALTDIIDYEKYDAYRARWNDNYETLYKNINATAIGAYSSLRFLANVILNDVTRGKYNDFVRKIWNGHLNLVDPALTAISALKILTDLSLGFAKAIILRGVVGALNMIAPKSKVIAALNILTNELFYDSSIISFANDTLVDFKSQTAKDYTGFIRQERKFTEKENIDFTLLAKCDTPVVHNLEPRDEKILNKVMNAVDGLKNGIAYETKQDGTVSITKVSKELIEKCTTSSYTIPSVIDGKTVTEIGDDAYYGVFDYFNPVKTIIIPSSIKAIGKNAFRGNKYITGVTIENQSDEVAIGESAFAECEDLITINLPGKLKEIADGTFAECRDLGGIVLPATVNKIGGGAFSGCFNLASVNGINRVTEIGDYAFYECRALNGISFNAGLKKLGNFAFANCGNMTGNIVVPQGITQIADGTFSNCKKITTITLNQSVTVINDYAFSGCEGLTSINIPKNVTSIGSNAFLGCKGITSITADTGNEIYKTEGNCLIKVGNDKKIMLLACNDSVIPADITAVEDFACSNCDEMTSFVGLKVEYIGVGAFYGCNMLTNVTLSGALTEIKDNAFTDCTSLAEIVLPDNVNKLGCEVFSGCSALEKITLPDNLAVIGEEAFINCTQLQEIILGNKLTGIANKAFYGCQNLEKVVISAGNDMVYVGSETFDDTSDELVIYVPKQSYENYLNDAMWSEYANKLALHQTAVSLDLNGGSVADASEISFVYGAYVGSLPQAEKDGYYFYGWYLTPEFDGVKMTSAVFWESFADNIMLYARFGETPESEDTDTYEILYNNVEDATYVAGTFNPLSYTQTTPSITLCSPVKEGFRFIGWYTTENFNCSVIKQIPQGSSGDIILYAKWAKLYTISFNSGAGTPCSDIQAIEGEIIKLPAPVRNGYTGTWERWEDYNNSYSVSNFGMGYEVKKRNETLNAVWKGNRYNVIYHNAKRYGRSPTMYFTSSYICGEETYILAPKNFYGDIFKGYYTDFEFKNRIYAVPADVYGDYDVYVKWDSYACETYRSISVKITDSGIWNQHYDDIDIYLNKDSYPEKNKYNYIKFTIELEIWEKDDGYQYLMLYDKYDNTVKPLWSVQIEHVPGKKSAAHHTYYFQFYVDIKDEDWSTDRYGKTYYNKYFYLLYGASGYKEDDWYNANLRMQAYLCVDMEDEVTPATVVWDGKSA